MTPQSHVTSLELSKKLVEVGWKKKTKFWWIITSTTNWHLSYGEPDSQWKKMNKGNYIPAPLVVEILKELPATINGNKLRIILLPNRNISVSYGLPDNHFVDEYLPNVLAVMYYHLKQKGII